jgi:hypothetical protein
MLYKSEPFKFFLTVAPFSSPLIPIKFCLTFLMLKNLTCHRLPLCFSSASSSSFLILFFCSSLYLFFCSSLHLVTVLLFFYFPISVLLFFFGMFVSFLSFFLYSAQCTYLAFTLEYFTVSLYAIWCYLYFFLSFFVCLPNVSFRSHTCTLLSTIFLRKMIRFLQQFSQVE